MCLASFRIKTDAQTAAEALRLKSNRAVVEQGSDVSQLVEIAGGPHSTPRITQKTR